MAAMSSSVETGRGLTTVPQSGKANGPIGLATFPQSTVNEFVHNGQSTVAMATTSVSVGQSHGGYNLSKPSRDGTVATVIERLDSTSQDKEDEEIIVDEGGRVSGNMQTGLSSLLWLLFACVAWSSHTFPRVWCWLSVPLVGDGVGWGNVCCLWGVGWGDVWNGGLAQASS